MPHPPLLPMLLVVLAWLALVQPAAAREPARIYAAASLTDAMADVADAYATTGAPRPRLIFAGSSELARQIQQGAPAGVFVSADTAWMDRLARAGRIATATRVPLLTNRLVLVVPAGEARRVAIGPGFSLARFVGDRRWVTGDPEAVPVGRYARAALERLGAWEAAAPKLARTGDVRSALAFVERGDAAAGVVYATDAAVSRRVAVAGVFPPRSHPPIVYPLALTRGAPPEAARFHRFLRLSRAAAIFRAHGFGVVGADG